MLSDSALVLDAKLGATRRAFHAALVSASEQLRSMLESEVDQEKTSDTFSGGFVNASSFGALGQSAGQVNTEKKRVRAARNILVELLELGDDLYRVKVAPGMSVRSAVSRAYGRIGRSFAAAHSASVANAGKPVPEGEADKLERNNFRNWTAVERALAPGLLIEIQGEDLLTDGLSEFLDGNACLAFLVSGACSPAPLVGLVRPGVFVAQSKNLDPFGMPDRGPAVVAVLAEADAAATFTHRPAGLGESGMGIWSRLIVETLPEAAPGTSLGPKSAYQQREELRQLASLSIAPSVSAADGSIDTDQELGVPAVVAATGVSTEPVDGLAAWLLSKAK
ncbi:MAG: hypothetical protein ACJAZ8_002099 [Planctomycetota bacterium]